MDNDLPGHPRQDQMQRSQFAPVWDAKWWFFGEPHWNVLRKGGILKLSGSRQTNLEVILTNVHNDLPLHPC